MNTPGRRPWSWGWLAAVTVVGCSSPCGGALPLRFTVVTGAPPAAAPVAWNDSLLLYTHASTLMRVRTRGTVAWQTTLPLEGPVSLAAAAGSAVLAAPTQWVAVDVADGQLRWRLSHPPRRASALAYDALRLYVLAADGTVQAFLASTGEPVWRAATGKAGPLAPSADRPLELKAGRLVAASAGALHCFDAVSGMALWEQPQAAAGLGMSAEQVVLTTTEPPTLVALDARTGTQQWSASLPAPPSGAPVHAGGKVWVGLEAPTLLVYSTGGALEGRFELPARWSGSLGEAGDQVFIPTTSEGGLLFAWAPGQVELRRVGAFDSPLGYAPGVFGETALLVPHDGRVVGLSLTALPQAAAAAPSLK